MNRDALYAAPSAPGPDDALVEEVLACARRPGLSILLNVDTAALAPRLVARGLAPRAVPRTVTHDTERKYRLLLLALLYFERVAPAFQRCKSQQKRCSYGRDRIPTLQNSAETVFVWPRSDRRRYETAARSRAAAYRAAPARSSSVFRRRGLRNSKSARRRRGLKPQPMARRQSQWLEPKELNKHNRWRRRRQLLGPRGGRAVRRRAANQTAR